MKKTAVFVTAAALSFSAAALADTPKVFYNGVEMTFDVAPYISEDRTMVPFRAIFEKAGAEVTWDEETQTVIAVKQEGDSAKSITLQVGNTTAFVGSEGKALDKAAEIIGDRTFVPLRFVMEALEAEVTWDQESYSVYITEQ